MRLRAFALSAGLVAANVALANAQTSTTAKITSGAIGTAVTSGGSSGYPAGTPNFYVSPYSGLIDYNTATGTGTSVSLNCVDYFHDVYIGDVWTANVTNLGAASTDNSLLANTRYGNAAGPSGYTNVLDLYKEAAWLTTQYDANPGASGSADKTRAIQSAIWSLFNPLAGVAPAFDGPGVDENDSAWWLTQVSPTKLSDADLQYFSILTDNTSPWTSDSKQEFIIHTTPEPGTIILMLTGMAALLIVVRRRRPATSGLESA
jgi:hypothetical protein